MLEIDYFFPLIYSIKKFHDLLVTELLLDKHLCARRTRNVCHKEISRRHEEKIGNSWVILTFQICVFVKSKKQQLQPKNR